MAGTTVDVALFPLDTIKTRLQSPQGFLKSGGFKDIYKGLSVAAVGSAPGAALFFGTYETLKQKIGEFNNRRKMDGKKVIPEALVHMTSASIGEVVGEYLLLPTVNLFESILFQR